jgi:hypothetical protein
MTGNACRALATGNHRGDYHRASKPTQRVFTRGNHAPSDFVTQNQWKWMPRRNVIKGKTNIGVTDPAARDFYDYIVTPGFKCG